MRLTFLENRFRKICFLLIATHIGCASLYAQNVMTVYGTVTDKSGQPLKGVNVVGNETKQGSSTDNEGKFFLSGISENSIVSFSHVGYLSKEIKVGKVSPVKVVLEVAPGSLNEIVVVGYGTQKKRDLTGSIAQIDASQYETQSTTNLLEMLSGTVAGFESNQGTSSKGGGSMLIRGQKSLKASNNPLIVLNGVIFTGSIADINPADIETMDILKDASSAAVYGSRAAAGVIIVTTKSGKTGKPSLRFNSETGLTSARMPVRTLTPTEYIDSRGHYLYQEYGTRPLYYYLSPKNLPDGVTLDDWLNLDPTVSDDPIDMWLNRLNFTPIEKKNYGLGNTINWLDEVFRTGIKQNYNLNVSGGSQDLQYYISSGYTKNQGILRGDNFSTYRAKATLNLQATNYLKISADVNYSHRKITSQTAGLEQAIKSSPFGDMYGDDGNLTFYPNGDIASSNPLLNTNYRDLYYPTDNLFTTFSAEVLLPWGIKYKPSFVTSISSTREYLFDPITTINGFNQNGYGKRSNSTERNWMVDNLLTWHKTFDKKHNVDLTFLYNIEKNQSWSDVQTNTNFSPNGNLSWHALQAGINPALNNNDETNTGMALMGRINYSYFSKYMLTMTLRRDGFSAFGQHNPWALFPSAAVAWRISDEKFFKIRVINDLKLRFSWGSNGNRSIGPYDALSRLNTSRYIYGTEPTVGVFSTQMANRNLRWETTQSFNAGLDLNMFNNRVSLIADAYISNTSNLLVDRTLPDIIGYSNVSANLGEIENRGIEITINTVNVDKPSFYWESSFVYSHNRNKILRLYGDMEDILDSDGNVIGQKEADDYPNQWFIGQSIDRIWDYETIGVWQMDEEEEAIKYRYTPGDFKLKDQNDDGLLTPREDKVFQGYTRPRFRLGWRNDIRFLQDFELSFFIRADLGAHKADPLYTSPRGVYRSNILYAPYWTEENPSNEYPKVRGVFGASVWKNASYVRIQDISLSYNLSKEATDFLQIQQLKMYLSFRNFVTLTKWKNWDPESGTTPMPKNVTFGLNVNF